MQIDYDQAARRSHLPTATTMTSPPPSSGSTPLTQEARQHLDDVRRGLLRVHKALLDDARIRYEREQGRIEGSGALLRLVLNDPWFAWLHPLSGLVVQIDELLAADEPTVADGDALLNQARALMRPDSNGEWIPTPIPPRDSGRPGRTHRARGSGEVPDLEPGCELRATRRRLPAGAASYELVLRTAGVSRVG